MSDTGKYDEVTAVACLKRNGVDVKGKLITLKRAGIKVWGAIDYLVNNREFSYMKEEKKYA
ncbi:MAG: hypothetical protein KAJ19_13100 [Gammaproteobacteria bacterium]|nr:hypothetical protein [Gammaproteobacteria bacterium]